MRWRDLPASLTMLDRQRRLFSHRLENLPYAAGIRQVCGANERVELKMPAPPAASRKRVASVVSTAQRRNRSHEETAHLPGFAPSRPRTWKRVL